MVKDRIFVILQGLCSAGNNWGQSVWQIILKLPPVIILINFLSTFDNDDKEKSKNSIMSLSFSTLLGSSFFLHYWVSDDNRDKLIFKILIFKHNLICYSHMNNLQSVQAVYNFNLLYSFNKLSMSPLAPFQERSASLISCMPLFEKTKSVYSTIKFSFYEDFVSSTRISSIINSVGKTNLWIITLLNLIIFQILWVEWW